MSAELRDILAGQYMVGFRLKHLQDCPVGYAYAVSDRAIDEMDRYKEAESWEAHRKIDANAKEEEHGSEDKEPVAADQGLSGEQPVCGGGAERPSF
jgi:hypothetical protein